MNKILLFIPMYNCEKQITRVLGQLTDEVCSYLSEVIIVNNRSSDNGEQAVQDYLSSHTLPLKASLLRNDDNYGLGGSHKVAFQYAIDNGFDYVIVLHGDDQGRIADCLPLLQSNEYEKYDCCLGARFMPDSTLEGYSKFRTFGNVVFNLYFSLLGNMAVYDLGAGLNIYNTKMLKDRFFIGFPDNLMFNCYMLLATKALKAQFRFFPISWRETDQVSNVKMLNQALKTLQIPLIYAFTPKDRFLRQERRDKPVESYSAEIVFSNARITE